MTQPNGTVVKCVQCGLDIYQQPSRPRRYCSRSCYAQSRVKDRDNPPVAKACGTCGETKPLNSFYNDRARWDGKTHSCKDCINAASRTPEKNHAVRLARHRIDDAAYATMNRTQRGRCAICHRKLKLNIDHDHKTGKVRGLLCRSCNQGLGFFQDSPKLLQAAINYIEVTT